MRCIIPFQRIETEHICCHLTINEQAGFFLIDTGASNSCVAKMHQEFYQLTPKEKPTEAAGAGTEKLEAHKMEDALWKSLDGQLLGKFPVMLLDLESINTTLANQGAPAIDGIIGADLLIELKTVIDYKAMELRLEL